MTVPTPAGTSPPRPPPGRTRRGPGAWRGAALFLAGVVLLGVGAGLGLPHLVKQGVSVLTVLGLAALLTGLAAVLLGGRRLLGGVRRRWWPLLVPALLLALWAGLGAVGPAVLATHVPATPLDGRDPGTYGLRYRTVRLPAADGTPLAAWYVPSRNGAAVAIAHGSGSNRTAALRPAAVLARHGYGVLLLDARGHGTSAGTAMDFGWAGESDLAGAVDFLARRPDVEPGRIGLVGLSMGGEEAIGAAGADPRVRAVVAEGAMNRVLADRGWLAHYGLRGRLQQGLDWLTYRLAGLMSEVPAPVSLRASVRAAAPHPLLLVTAGTRPDELLAARLVRAASPANVVIWTVPGAGHTGGLAAHPAAWERRVVGFLDRQIGAGR